jgi:hypothetical protein
MSESINLLGQCSVFLRIADAADIEHERNQMERQHGERLAVFSIECVIRHGVRCTRVTWQCL